ncbi:MAG: hypothetical protein D6E12_16845 [Desulfovibrio sp.]|nr:MAG: hypothetical protein D6E12_16845 [Desulfovibrio sp.]
MDLHHWLVNLAVQAGQVGVESEWEGWPFGHGGFWPSVARLAFMAAILVGIGLFLRYLFGPGGPMRGEGFETVQEAQERRAAEAEADPRQAEASETPKLAPDSDPNHE